MTEKDKEIQDLRRENERLRHWIDELEWKAEELQKFITWLNDTGFGPEQFGKVADEYMKDTGTGFKLLS